MLAPWKKSYDQPRQHTKKQRHYFTNKHLSNQSYGFSSSHVWMSELDHKESWVPKNWCFGTVVLEKTLESPLDCKEIKPVNPRKWVLIIHWKDWWWSWNANPLPADAKSSLIRNDPDAGQDWKQEKGMAEDEMVGWHHRLNGHEFEQAPGVGDVVGNLVCYSTWGHKESNMTEWLNWLTAGWSYWGSQRLGTLPKILKPRQASYTTSSVSQSLNSNLGIPEPVASILTARSQEEPYMNFLAS